MSETSSLNTDGNTKSISEIIAHLEQVREERPSVKMAEGKTDRTTETIKKILAASQEIFTQDGHAGLSLRKVAERAGIAVGNLTYHFPTKRSLLDAMLLEARADYAEAHIEQYSRPSKTPLEILQNVMEYYVRDARESNRFFMQMWGYAASDEAGKEKVLGLYRPLGRFIYYLVREANPTLDDQQIRHAVLQISSLEEGMKMFFGAGSSDDETLQAAEGLIREMTEKIVKAE